MEQCERRYDEHVKTQVDHSFDIGSPLVQTMRFIPLKLSHVSDQDHQDIVDQYDDQWRQIAFEELSKNAIFNPFKLKQMLLVLVLQLRENDCGR